MKAKNALYAKARAKTLMYIQNGKTAITATEQVGYKERK
jgi:hypothetical protein